MFFGEKEIERTSDYGSTVKSEDMLKKVEGMLMYYGILFDADYERGRFAKLKEATDLLLDLGSILRK